MPQYRRRHNYVPPPSEPLLRTADVSEDALLTMEEQTSVRQAREIVARFQQNRSRLAKLERQITELGRENAGLVNYLQSKSVRDRAQRAEMEDRLLRLQREKNALEAQLAEEREHARLSDASAAAKYSEQVLQRTESKLLARKEKDSQLREVRSENARLRKEVHSWKMAALNKQREEPAEDAPTKEQLVEVMREKQRLEFSMQEALRELEGLRSQSSSSVAAKQRLEQQVEYLQQQLHDVELQASLNSQHYNAVLTEVKRQAELAIKDAERRASELLDSAVPGAGGLRLMTAQTDAVMRQMHADLQAANAELARLRAQQGSAPPQPWLRQRSPSPAPPLGGGVSPATVGAAVVHPRDVVYEREYAERGGYLVTPRTPSPDGSLPVRGPSAHSHASLASGRSVRSDRSRRTFL